MSGLDALRSELGVRVGGIAERMLEMPREPKSWVA